MKKGKLFVIALLILVLGAFFVFDLGQYLSFNTLKAQQQNWQASVTMRPVLSMLFFFVVYVVLVAFSIPGAALLSLVAGALFGVWKGLFLVSFASTLGATLAFLGARYLFKDTIQHKFGDKLAAINVGVEKEGAFYLFGLRLVPLFPFFLVNLLMAVTPIKVWVFYIVSQIGMLPGTLVYVNAGTQLSKLENATGILSPTIIFSFVLLAMFPFVAKKILIILRGANAKV